MKTKVIALAPATLFLCGCVMQGDPPVAAHAINNFAAAVTEGAAFENCFKLDVDAARFACEERIRAARKANRSALAATGTTADKLQDFDSYRRERDGLQEK